MQKAKETKTVDITPTWAALAPMLKRFIMEGTQKQRELVCEELGRLCQTVDDVQTLFEAMRVNEEPDRTLNLQYVAEELGALGYFKQEAKHV